MPRVTDRFILPAIALLLPTPVLAQAAVQAVARVPEAPALTLFGLGIAGIIIGRRLSLRKSDED